MLQQLYTENKQTAFTAATVRNNSGGNSLIVHIESGNTYTHITIYCYAREVF